MHLIFELCLLSTRKVEGHTAVSDSRLYFMSILTQIVLEINHKFAHPLSQLSRSYLYSPVCQYEILYFFQVILRISRFWIWTWLIRNRRATLLKYIKQIFDYATRGKESPSLCSLISIPKTRIV